MKKGDVYIADLSGSRGSEQAGIRPVLIIQSDKLNKYTQTVVAIPITTNLRRAQIPGCVLLPQGEGGLIQDSVALCYQIKVLAKSRLQSRIGSLSPEVLKQVEEAIKTTFEMD
ncbi:MAG: type II toxin-antitoxin system PemK/MazF family toxin [Candidatus Aminicenantes bacterium]